MKFSSKIFSTIVKGGLASSLLLSGFLFAQNVPPPIPKPVDADSDGLIEINNLDDLNEIRNSSGGRSLRGSSVGCPVTRCFGYELTRDLDFDTNGNGRLDSGDWNQGKSWVPIPSVSHFDGNNHSIRNLFLTSQANSINVALFSSATNLRNIRLEKVKVNVAAETTTNIAALAIWAGYVQNCFVEGDIEATGKIGFLTGLVSVANSITNSGFVGSIKATADLPENVVIAGLVIQAIAIDSSYAIVDIEAANSNNVTGLANNTNALISSYAVVDITANKYIAGLAGNFLISNAEMTSDRFRDNYVIGKILTNDAVTAHGLVGGVIFTEDAIVNIKSNYSSVEITEVGTGNKSTSFQSGYLSLTENAGLTTSKNYWVRDPYGAVLPHTGNSIVLSEQGVSMTDLQLMQNDQLSDVFYVGTDTELPRLIIKNYYPWVSRDRPNSSGDYETIGQVKTHSPQYACDAPIDFLVKEKKSGYVFSAKTPQVFDFFNAKQGLKCSDAKQSSGRCDDYEVSYLCGDESVTPQWTALSNSDNPNDGVDNESIPSTSVCASGSPIGIRAKAKNTGIYYYGAPQIPYNFNLRKGFTCRNADNGGSSRNNTCKDYEVRMVCEGYSLTSQP